MKKGMSIGSVLLLIVVLILWAAYNMSDLLDKWSTFVNSRTVDESQLSDAVPAVDPEVEILTSYMQARNSKMPVELANIQALYIVNSAKRKELPVELVVGVIEAETIPPFNPFSESSVGATGLMQIYQAPNVQISDKHRFDIEYNIEIGCAILKAKLTATDGDVTKALNAYSGGAQNYASRVYERLGRYTVYRYTQNVMKALSAVSEVQDSDSVNDTDSVN